MAGVGAALSKEPMDLGGTKTLKAPSLPSHKFWPPGRRPSHQPGPGDPSYFAPVLFCNISPSKML